MKKAIKKGLEGFTTSSFLIALHPFIGDTARAAQKRQVRTYVSILCLSIVINSTRELQNSLRWLCVASSFIHNAV